MNAAVVLLGRSCALPAPALKPFQILVIEQSVFASECPVRWLLLPAALVGINLQSAAVWLEGSCQLQPLT